MCPRGRPRGQGRPRGLHLWKLNNRYMHYDVTNASRPPSTSIESLSSQEDFALI